jgi:hypothetical protein
MFLGEISANSERTERIRAIALQVQMLFSEGRGTFVPDDVTLLTEIGKKLSQENAAVGSSDPEEFRTNAQGWTAVANDILAVRDVIRPLAEIPG